MRCKACDTILDDVEMARKDIRGNYWDMCSNCVTHSLSAVLDMEELYDDNGDISQDTVLTLDQECANIYLSITKEDT